MSKTSKSPGPSEKSAPAKNSTGIGYVVAAAILAVAIAGVLVWRYSPLSQLLDPYTLMQVLNEIRSSPFSGPAAVGLFVALSMLGCPVLVLTAGTSLAFGSWLGLFYSLLATMISALLTFGLGGYFGKPILRAIGEGKLASINQALGRHGLVTAIIMRIAPIAPFPILNLVAGASHMRVLPYTLGTLIGVMPALATISGFGASLELALSNPSPETLWLPALLVVGWLLVVLLIHRFLRRRAKLLISNNR